MNENFLYVEKKPIIEIIKAILTILLLFGILLFGIIVDDNHIQLSSEYYYEIINSDHTKTIYTYWILGFISLCILNFLEIKTSTIKLNMTFGIIVASNIYSIIYIVTANDYRLTLAPIIYLILSTVVLLSFRNNKLKNIKTKKDIITSFVTGFIIIPAILVIFFSQEIDSIFKIHEIETKKYLTR